MDLPDAAQFPAFPLTDLHAHLAASINPSIYWQIAHAQGFKLPKKDYHEFIDYITLSPEKKRTMQEYFDNVYHPLLDKLSSGTAAVERATYEIMGGAYRNGIKIIELRNNPMKHNSEGQQDLDYIIFSMLRGMERALLEYKNLSAGIIFCLDRQFSYGKNEILVEKAIRYHQRGIVGLDFANYSCPKFHFKDYKKLIAKACRAGLKITAHCGETADTNDMWEALEFVHPDRIGHGIKAAYDRKLMQKLAASDIVLEVCPLSNIVTQAVENWEEMEFILKTFLEHKVKFCINTDWPEIIENGHLWRQYRSLLEKKILSESELTLCSKIAQKATFVPKGGLEAYL